MNNKIEYQFSAIIWQYATPIGGWYFVNLPPEISSEIRENLKWQEGGWGRLKAVARINTTTWGTAIWFDSKTDTYQLPLKAAVRKKEGLGNDQTVLVTIWI